jgi:hypothetical protein
MNSVLRTVLVAAVGAVGMLCQTSRADTVTATLGTVIPYAFPTISLDGTQESGGVGLITWQGQAGNPLGLTGAFGTYCIDLNQNVYLGNPTPYTFTVTPLASSPQPGAYPAGDPNGTGPMGAVKASELNTLYAEQFNGLSTDDQFQAFQAAVWAIVYDTPTELATDPDVSASGNNFYIVGGLNDGTVVGLANSYLAAAVNLSAQETYSGTLVALVGENGAQDQVYATPTNFGSPGTPVPLPRTSIGGCVLLGMCGLGAIAKKRRAELA